MTDSKRCRLWWQQPVECSRVAGHCRIGPGTPDMNQRRRIRAFAGILVDVRSPRRERQCSSPEGDYPRDDATPSAHERFAPDL